MPVSIDVGAAAPSSVSWHKKIFPSSLKILPPASRLFMLPVNFVPVGMFLKFGIKIVCSVNSSLVSDFFIFLVFY